MAGQAALLDRDRGLARPNQPSLLSCGAAFGGEADERGLRADRDVHEPAAGRGVWVSGRAGQLKHGRIACGDEGGPAERVAAARLVAPLHVKGAAELGRVASQRAVRHRDVRTADQQPNASLGAAVEAHLLRQVEAAPRQPRIHRAVATIIPAVR